MIEVKNGRSFGWIGGDYIGRGMKGKKGSSLRNIFKIGVDGDRDEVIKKYRNWLWEIVKKKEGKEWDELMKLVDRYKNGEDLVLICWCKPEGCHGDILKKCIEYLG